MSDDEYTPYPDDEVVAGDVFNKPTINVDGAVISWDTLYERGVDPEDVEYVTVAFEDTENAEQTADQEAAPLGWVNSAAIQLDRDENTVAVSISVGDPRGAFVMKVRRLPDGKLMMYVPNPSNDLLHRPLTEVRPGVYEIG